MSGFDIDLAGLEDKWTRVSLDRPTCAACGLRVGGEEEEEGPEGPEIPFRVYRGDGAAMEELALHWKCAEERTRRARPERN